MSIRKIFTPAILLLGFVSLLNDISSEMLYPVLSVYLKSINYSAIGIGLLEGIAEATAGLSKGYFGKLSDQKGTRMPFVRLGYFISALSKSFLVCFINPIWVFTCRISDKFGKGIRTSARDAVLSDECEPQNRGKIFGFHRAMDTVGATIGPLFALGWLWLYPKEYKTLFLVAFIPAIAGVLLTLFVKEKVKEVSEKKINRNIFSFFSYWKQSGKDFRKVAGGLIFFALFNSSDMFLLLMAKHQGLSDTNVILVYVFYNLVYALFAYPAGWMADKFGMKFSICLGLFFFLVTYAGMALTTDIRIIFALFFVYGLYAASTDGISKAWLTRLVPKSETGTALGFLAGCTSIAAVLASSITGLAWETATAEAALMFSAVAAGATLVYFSCNVFERKFR